MITSHEAYKEAIGDFTEGLILGSYSFDKYKTKKEKSDKNKSYPSKLMLLGDLTEAEIQWLNDLTDAYILPVIS